MKETIRGVPVEELPDLMRQLFEDTVRRGVRFAAATLEPHYRNPCRVPRPKTRTEKITEEARLEAVVEVLDRDFRWIGEFGLNAFAIHMELRRRAQEQLQHSQ